MRTLCRPVPASRNANCPQGLPIPPFSLTFGRFFGKMSCRSDCVARTRLSRDLRHSSSRQARDLRTSFGILDCRNLDECTALFSSHQREALDEADTLQVAHASAVCADCGGLRYSPLCDGIRYSYGSASYILTLDRLFGKTSYLLRCVARTRPLLRLKMFSREIGSSF